jgi:hypothetical protein
VLFRGAGVVDLALRQGFRLHFQVDFRIDVGRVQRNMAEPRTNGIDVYAGAEQVCRRRMTTIPGPE